MKLGGCPLANVSLALRAVPCSGKKDLVVEYAEETIDIGTIDKVINKTRNYC